MKKALLFSTSIFFMIIGFLLYANPNNITIPLQMSQDVGSYNTNQDSNTSLLSNQIRQKQINYFKKQYFHPWSKDALQKQFCYVPGNIETCRDVTSLEKGTISYYRDKRGYNNLYEPLDGKWVIPISNNMDMQSFPNVSCNTQSGCRGIVVKNAQVRSLPTEKGFYNDFTIPGEGYPFDYIQLADFWIGTPVQLLQITKDHKWVLVKGQGVMGWIPYSAVARVSDHLINLWEKLSFVTPVVRKQEIGSHYINRKYTMYLGSILPKYLHFVLVPFRMNTGMAGIHFMDSLHLSINTWPLLPTKNNFEMQIHALLGMPYGWGGKDFHSDCSGALRRLFTSFGIWIPRSSYYQANYAGGKYSLANISTEQRKNIIIGHSSSKKPTPFLTLISFGNTANSTSHIGLYIGDAKLNKKSIAVMFNELWGVKITHLDQSGRALVSQSAITPVGVGDVLMQSFNPKGWTLSSLWDKPGMNLTTIGLPYAATGLSTDSRIKPQTQKQQIYEYLFHR